MESILTSVKKVIGVGEEDTNFDPEIIIHINTMLMFLTQQGVGPAKGFRIYDDQALWSDFIPDDAMLDAAKTYVSLKVKLVFDPPQSSVLLDAIRESVKEAGWYLGIAAESL